MASAETGVADQADLEHPQSSSPSPAIATWFSGRDRIPVICASLVLAVALYAIPQRIIQGGYLSYVSGAWAALADDVAHGVLYRPLMSDLGYGGTRYFPLHPVLHGLLVKLGLSLRVAGHLVSVLATCVLVGGAALGLRRRGASLAVACSGGLLAIASRTAFMGAAGIRGDILPIALGVLGLSLVPRHAKESTLPAGICLGFSLLAKPTLIWAPAGACLALFMAARFRSAVNLSLIMAVTTLLGLAGSYGWSHGEMLRSFTAVASGGGFSLKDLSEHLQFVRPGDLAWIFGGLGLTALRGRRALQEPFCAASLVCLPVMLVLFAGAGIHSNHLIDPTTIGALATVSAFADEQVRRTLTERVLVVASILGLGEAWFLHGMLGERGELERTVAAIPAGPQPILSEQPWVPLLAGERAFVLDAYALNLTRHTSAALEHDLLSRLDHCAFRAVVLLGRPEVKNDFWYDRAQFGAGFREHLARAYLFVGIAGAHAIYLPSCGANVRPETALHETETITDRGHRLSKLYLLMNWLGLKPHDSSVSASKPAADVTPPDP